MNLIKQLINRSKTMAEEISDADMVAALDGATEAVGEVAARPATPSSMSKRWLATVFSEDWVPAFDDSVAYGVWQRERCPTTGRVHVHVYYRFKNRKRLTSLQRWMGQPDCHVDLPKGTEGDCKAYCTKAESRVEAGVECNPQNYDADLGRQGARTDLDKVVQKCKAGVSLSLIADAHPTDYIRYHSGIQALHELVRPVPPLQREVRIVVLWGSTGVGKTHRALTSCPSIYTVKPGRDPWGNYRQEEDILFDEFRDTQWPITDMNRYRAFLLIYFTNILNSGQVALPVGLEVQGQVRRMDSCYDMQQLLPEFVVLNGPTGPGAGAAEEALHVVPPCNVQGAAYRGDAADSVLDGTRGGTEHSSL